MNLRKMQQIQMNKLKFANFDLYKTSAVINCDSMQWAAKWIDDKTR